MLNKQITRIKSIQEYHRLRGLPKPEHPLVSLFDYSLIKFSPENNDIVWVNDFYFIALKRNLDAKIIYGQQDYDFDEGTMFFISPGQAFRIESKNENAEKSGMILLVHPDFLWNMALAKTIKRHEFFGYSVREALFLSQKEEEIILGTMQNIRQECQQNIDKFSQQIVVSYIEVLLNYADRFYNRQFITRKMGNYQILDQLEVLLEDHFNGRAAARGLPTVHHLAERLHLSSDYLSTLLKLMTGLNTQQHIHEKLIAKAKEKLGSTNMSISEIAYELGFEHSQSFSKLFKLKTKLSPLKFREFHTPID
ncbi:helix-turn-helix domain-containing protein [Pedobacter antarcticus]|uniref:AraC family transcriptional regulator n=2 Tax=Pedobacter antarcticus TaxID=34086 RepID=A0A081PEK9_9SPHI|nr:AraC family transcriptional regulator [Pedobacter antarcticus]KEQ29132.1 AraC family transcriptional regulator [Pedobacter antarcticus 4BY]SDM37264.1 transcriptional regulator, AraC family [Pedobacter antarcticus]SFE94838.1 AraC-type DNA-binding protein [Pedobacter antarcticus]